MKIGKQSLIFNNAFIADTSTIVGPTEGQGPLSCFFDKVVDDLRIGCDSFEQAEIRLQEQVLKLLLKKTLELESNIDLVFSGDLINQDVISNYSLRNYDIPFCGLYGACSTSVLGLIMSALAVDSHNALKVISMTSSHNLASERQYRSPTEYGGAKPDTSTFTVTGACAALVTSSKQKIKISGATLGKVIDVGFKDPLDMGRAMAPAACETILSHFEDFNSTPKDYDLIVTGDLSAYGSEIVRDVIGEKYQGFINYNDCGLMIFDKNHQKVFAGGSGCACCGVVTYGYIKKRLEEGTLKKVLICATGALMNPNMSLQKESIPAICHAVVLEAV